MKVSIITITYNSEATIRDTIESVINQTYKNIQNSPIEELRPIKKAKKKKVFDNTPHISIESFYTDSNNEIIPKDKITRLDGGSF